MASHAAMLLDPRSYKKQLQGNGTGSESPLEPSHFDEISTSEEPNDHLAFLPSSGGPPPSNEDTSDLDAASSIRSHGGQTGQQDSDGPARNADSGMSPAGTVPAAHHLLDPKHRQPPTKIATMSSPRGSSTRSSSVNSTGSSIQNGPKPESGMGVEFVGAPIENGSDVKRNFGQVDKNTEGSHGSLIEDMYGVERRENQPYKRVKTEHEDQKAKSAMGANFVAPGDSELGEWMKEGQGKAGSSAVVAPSVVDLTADASSTANDDDDLLVTGSNNLSIQRVCYGKLENAMIQASFVPKPGASSVFADSTHDWPSMKLGIYRKPTQDTRVEVSDPHEQTFGTVDAKTAAVIVPLLDSPALMVDVTARLDVRRRLPGEEPWVHCSALYRASINIYGLRKDADLVGRHLGQNNVWLGTPNSVEQGVPVFNPHAERRRAQAAILPAVAVRSRPGVNYEVRTAEEVNDAVMKMFDQLQSTENIPEMEAPSHIKTHLLRHQKQALWFMTEKEKPRKFGPEETDNNSLWRIQYLANGNKCYREIISGIALDDEPPQVLGGLLADMMGLGKTLSILSLVVASKAEAGEWANMIPHADLVRDYPGIRNTRTTLLVSPLSAVNNWVTQVKEHLAGSAVSFYVFHGSSRTTDVDELAKYDLVITTYSIVLSELSGRGSRRGVSPLTKMNMFRVVLDEAHTIREQNAAQTQAIFKLNSQRRWSVTGTPVQNRLEDLFSVTKFLRLFPYDDRSKFGAHILSRFKTGDTTVLASLRVLVDSFTLRRVKDKIDLPARSDKIVTLDFSEKEKQLHEFFRKESNVMMQVIAGEDNAKMKGRIAHGKELLDSDDRQRIKGLSEHEAIDLDETADETEVVTDKKAYEMFSLMQESSADACGLCGKRLEEPSIDTGTMNKKAAMAIILPCFDVLCPDCFSGWKQAFDTQTDTSAHQIRCQVCDGWIPVSYSTITQGGLQAFMIGQAESRQTRKQGKTFGEYEGPHTKTNALISHLLDTAEENKNLESGPPVKSVVFSAWTSHLDLIEIALRDNGMTGYARLDGTMTLSGRKKALDAFADDDKITILLATIGAGGIGLNLTAASRVYMMEPQYNPAAVAQAVDRVHRLGQSREVKTIQFIMKDSIEEKILELGKKKQQLADLSMNRGKLDKKEVQEQRMRQYRGLFK
ncbi:SNF2 family helicase ATPase [Aspergillus sp. HF37]|nr:SNF2 family helicase ATPase [Aspergillus sp. HF37]